MGVKRAITVESGILPQCNGSARIRIPIDGTDVIASAKVIKKNFMKRERKHCSSKNKTKEKNPVYIINFLSKLEVCEPLITHPESGRIEIDVESSTITSRFFAKTDEINTQLSQNITRVILDCGVVRFIFSFFPFLLSFLDWAIPKKKKKIQPLC